MPRFFCPSAKISADTISLDDKEQVHHIRDVLRLKVEDRVVVFDTQGNVYGCIIEKISNTVILIIKTKRLPFWRQATLISIACAIPKKAKFDDIVDKLTQLGADRIIPMLTERVIVRWDKQKKILQQKRWEKIALNAAEQSQRNTLPVIEPVRNIKEVLSQSSGYDLKLIPYLTGERKTLKEINALTKAKNILILIGPEGDFTPEEVGLAIKAGCIPVTLGDNVLRVDTAAIAIASFIKFYKGLIPKKGAVPKNQNENR